VAARADFADLDALKNEGVLALNKPPSAAAEKTVIVLGPARGGTTMVASVLQALGVTMGEKLGPVLEDVELSQAVEARERPRLQEIVARRNAAHPLWGWKRPSALEHSDVWQGAFRNPYVIAVFRDPFAIANRNRISMLSDVFQNMERSIEQLGLLTGVVRRQQGPVLLCSYEKALVSPATFVMAVDDFLDLGAQARHEDAIRRIVPSPREYLESSRITQSLGHLDVANGRFCAGWAFYPRQPATAATVQISVNDRLVRTVSARLPRPDVKEKGIHPTGLCGFKLDWPAGAAPRPGDRVAARVEGDTRPLGGSPREVQRGAAVPAANPPAATPRTAGKTAVGAARGALPSFYGIGAQKAGTTWLYEMLKAHPQIHLPARKEVHYWDLQSERPLEWYREHFKAGYINGDITPSYAVLPPATIDRVHAATPDARLLLSLRHPLDRAWSFVRMAIERRYPAIPADLAAGEPRGEMLAFVRQKLFHPGCLARNDYATIIRRWRQRFGDDALMWFRYERIAREPAALLSEICRHIGADAQWAKQLAPGRLERTVFASADIPFPRSLRAEYAERCRPFVDELEKLLGERFDDWRS
jgi:hypothetical protein